MSVDHRIERIVERVGDLPAVPEVVSQAIKLTDDPNVSMSSVADLIQRDPALSAKILRVSNSPYYGMRQYVGTLKLALVVLGVREVRNIVLGICVFDSLRDKNGDVLLANGLWKHSFMVAAIAKALGARMNLSIQGEAFISGLLHDIGKLVLIRQLGVEYARVYGKNPDGGEPLRAAEQDAFGFTHAAAAAALGIKWNFPVTLTDAIHLHHPSGDASFGHAKDPVLAALVHVADLAARDDFEDEDASPASLDDEHNAWGILAKTPAPISPADRYMALWNIVKPLKNSPVPEL